MQHNCYLVTGMTGKVDADSSSNPQQRQPLVAWRTYSGARSANDGRIRRRPVKRAAPTAMARKNITFTDRENDVVLLLLRGMSVQQIADKLGVRYYTVSTHMKNIYKKLGIHRRSEIFSMALANGWITTGWPGKPQVRTRNATSKKVK